MRKTLLLLLIVFIVIPVSAQSDACTRMQRSSWDGQSRFNILVLGMDRRPGARNNLNVRTDALMLVSYDPQNQSIGILDIPRDMFFAVMGMDEDLMRVNTLMVEGESLQENCGPFFAMEAFQLNLGMYVDAYVALDFEAFIEFVDIIGGITVDVPIAINDREYPNMNYGFSPLFIPAGLQKFDGYTALAYARTRHGDSDYLRGERQLQIVSAVQDRLSNPATLQDLVLNLPQIVNILNGKFYSNLPPEQLAFLGISMLQGDAPEINTGSLNLDYSFNYYYRGNRVRIPDRELLVQLLVDTFGEDYWR
jgi:polyisoprenyl-teichoic acid--peptidoglycan teichoic acid transferase